MLGQCGLPVLSVIPAWITGVSLHTGASSRLLTHFSQLRLSSSVADGHAIMPHASKLHADHKIESAGIGAMSDRSAGAKAAVNGVLSKSSRSGMEWVRGGGGVAVLPGDVDAEDPVVKRYNQLGWGAAAGRAAQSMAAGRPLSSPAKQTVGFDAQGLPLRTGRPRLVVLGTGWGGASLCRYINPKLYDITVVSPRNHMVFTPLLASTTVGTLEARAVAVHITDLQKALFQPQNYLYIADATAIHPERQAVECVSKDSIRFFVEYDRLVIATGSQGSTFGIRGVEEHCHFLRDVKQAEAIRQHLIDNVASAGIPGRDMNDWQRLLHIVIVGGGPTGVEVAGELSDFINRDLHKLYPDRAKATRITLIEAKELLGSFDGTLREYAARKLRRQGVELRKGVVKQVTKDEITLMDNTVIPYGLCIWSTGVGPTPFVTSLPFAKTPMGRLAIDSHLRVLASPKYDDDTPPKSLAQDGQGVSQLGSEADGEHDASWVPVPGVYALGDCSANLDKPLPALAQVAEQQGRYLAESLNKEVRNLDNLPIPAFEYHHLGSMATVGSHSAVLELSGPKRFSLAGFWSWVAWRSAYLTRLGSLRARLVVAVNWTMTLVFGRDMSRW